MAKLIFYIFAIIAISASHSCSTRHADSDIEDKIALAELVLDSMPDSTLAIIRELDIENIDNNELLAKAYYIKGSAKLKLWDYHGAISPLLYAEKQAETIRNYPLLAQSRQRIMELYDSIGSDNGVITYALKASEAYQACGDSISQFDILDNIVYTLYGMEKTECLDSITTIMTELTKNSTDSIRRESATHAETLANILKEILKNHRHINFAFIHDDEFFKKVYSNGDWQRIIASDSAMLHPSDIRSITNDLNNNGNEKLAHAIIDSYLNNYTKQAKFPKTLMRENNPIFPNEPQYYLPLTRESFLQEYIPMVEREAVEFYYKENVIKEQAIRYQRTKNTAILLCSGLLICLLAMSLFIVRSRKRRIEEESMRSVIELKSALSQSKDRWLSTLGQLCNTYYSAYAKTATRSRTAQEALAEIESATASPTFFPELEARLNRENDNLMARLRTAMPDLRPDEYHLFLLNALGFSIPTISLLLKEKREVIYNRRQRLRSKIQESDITDNAPFLDCLE
jgi:hypothetical protein